MDRGQHVSLREFCSIRHERGNEKFAHEQEIAPSVRPFTQSIDSCTLCDACFPIHYFHTHAFS